MFRRLKARFTRSEADRLATALDAQRAEQRNAESLLSRLRDRHDTMMARGSDEARMRLEVVDRDIAVAAARVKRALRLQADLLMRLGQPDEALARR